MPELINPRTDLARVAERLYRAALLAGCRCQYERNALGVPMWFPGSAGGVERKQISLCSKCAAIAAYEAIKGVACL